jgi:outer membrane lipoprotein carrier protein
MHFYLSRLTLFILSFTVSAYTVAASVTSFQGWSWLEKTKQIHAHFEQQIFNKTNSKIGPLSKGEFWIQRPGQFRWRYEKPSEQLTLSDGKQVTWYDPQLKQVIIKPADGALNNALAQLLTATASSLKQRFRSEQRNENNQIRLLITPLRPDQEGFQKAILYWNTHEPYTLERLEVIDGLEQHINLSLSELQLPTQTFSPALFHFTPPAGVTVLNDSH